MRAELRREMYEEAVRIAFPDWELQADDTIVFETIFDEGFRYSSYTYEDPTFKIWLEVISSEATGTYEDYRTGLHRQAEYRSEDAQDFLRKLLS